VCQTKSIQRMTKHFYYYTHIPTQITMGSRNISISDEAYSRLAALKGPNESFTDVINRLTGKRSILELAGVLTTAEGDELRREVEDLRLKSEKRVASTVLRMREP